LIEAEIGGVAKLDSKGLTREQRYLLALRILSTRSQRFRVLAWLAALFALLLSSLVVWTTWPFTEHRTSLRVEIKDVHSAQLLAGEASVSDGINTWKMSTDAIGGSAHFQDLPIPTASHELVVSAAAHGYVAPPSVKLTTIPHGNTVEFQLELAQTVVHGTVHYQDKKPIPGAHLLFRSATQEITSIANANGDFEVTLPGVAGDRLDVTPSIAGRTGKRAYVLIPGESRLEVFFDDDEESK
jgi:hypothetical protein